WQNPDFYDRAKIDAEMQRIFEICHSCRRCFNLCDSFPRLFDMIDNSATGDVDAVDTKDYAKVVEACTLCDMCFMTKCPYVPPHEWNVDFPHLMLRYRAADYREGKLSWAQRQLVETDRNGKLAAVAAPLVNWVAKVENRLTRPAMEKVADIDRRAALPKFHGRSFVSRAKADAPEVNAAAPAHGRRALLYATCFVNYNNPQIGDATRAVLARNGVATEAAYPGCCGMPHLEQGDIARVADSARKVAAALAPYVEQGYDIVALVPSCALMLKFEWPLILPEDKAVERLARATFDISEYVVDIARKEGLAPGLPRAGPGHGRQGGGDAAPLAAARRRGDRALLRPWRQLGRAQGEFRRGAQGRQAGGASGDEERQDLRRFGMPARGDAYPPGHGPDRRRRQAAGSGVPSDRALCSRLWSQW